MNSPDQAVFLSYASQDGDTARRIHDALRAAGIEVWFDQRELRGGDALDVAIRRQVRECALRHGRKPMTGWHSGPPGGATRRRCFRREFAAARKAAERAVSLNPLDAATAAFMGLLIAYSGDWARGCELAKRGLRLNPNLPGMYNYTLWHDAYGRQDYRDALDLALQLNCLTLLRGPGILSAKEVH